MRMPARALFALLVGSLALACSSETDTLDLPRRDAGTRDTGVRDAGVRDAGRDAGRDGGDVRDGGRDGGGGIDGGERDGGGGIDGGLTCGAAPHLYNGALCGGRVACRVAQTIQVDPAHSRNDAPDIQVDANGQPSILYSIAENGYFGYFAQRSPTQPGFTSTQTPFSLATGALSIRNGAIYALAYGGAFGDITFWMNNGGRWVEQRSFFAESAAEAGSLFADDGGCLHTISVVGAGPATQLAYQRRDGTGWNPTTLSGLSTFGTVAMAPDGVPQFIRWERSGVGWTLWWETPTRRAQMVARVDFSINVQGRIPFAVSNQPYMLFKREVADPLVGEQVTFATPGSGVPWIVAPVVDDDRTLADGCAAQPTMPDETCRYEVIRYIPLAIAVSGGGDARFLMTREHEVGELTSVCFPGGPCMWDGVPTRTGRLEIAAPGAMQPTVLVRDLNAVSATAVVDARGRIHVAAYVAIDGGTEVRYLVLESM